ncbi:MAG: YihY/virulence factor BrkB family protein [Burkholderiaceae bacterium]|nr:YihY/virulence factor BrkB family protein [Burkholderiaceae bacterium]
MPLRDRLKQVWAAVRAIPGVPVAVLAMRNYIAHQSANQAGSVAFSWLLSMFPLVLLLSAAAGFVGRPGDAAELVMRVLSYAPPVVRDVLESAVTRVLGHRSQALLALGAFATVWTASSGMQAVRTALNRAYGIEHGLPFWKARIKVTLLTVLVGVGMLVTFSSVVVMPHLLQLLNRSAPDGETLMWMRAGVRHAAAFIVLTLLYAVLYAWLPDRALRGRSIVPGAVVGALLWIGAALLLSASFRSLGKLVLIYGGLAGSVATMVFLYISAATLILGAELNGAIRQRADEKSQPRSRKPERPLHAPASHESLTLRREG